MLKIELKIFLKKHSIKAVGFLLLLYFSSLLGKIFDNFNQELIGKSSIPFIQLISIITVPLNWKVPVYSLIISIFLLFLTYKLYFHIRISKRNFKILEAIYGSGNTFLNITDQLNRSVENNRLMVVLSNGVAGDPTPGIRKNGKIKYKFNNEVFEKEYTENDTVNLP